MSPGEHTDLATALAAGGPLDPVRAVELVRQIAAAVDEAHANQKIHRDVNPRTIMLSDTGYAYLSAIGATVESADTVELSYRAPELITNTEVTYRADIFALTAVLYACLTGTPPYRSVTADAAALIDAHLSAAIPQPSRQQQGVPVGFDDVVARGMAKNPAERYVGVSALAAAAHAALGGVPVAATPDRQTDPLAHTTDATAVIRTSHLVAPTVSYPHSQPVPMPDLPVPGRDTTRRLRIAITIAALVTVGLVAAAVLLVTRHNASPTRSANATHHTYGSQQPVGLPFPGIRSPRAVAVDGAGNLYLLSSVPDTSGVKPKYLLPQQLFKLAPGATTATPIDFPGVDIREATDLAVDEKGTLYLCDGASVWQLATGSSSPIRLPFRKIEQIQGIAVDSAGTVYAIGVQSGVEIFAYTVKKLPVGATESTELPFGNIYSPKAVAVDTSGNIYISVGAKEAGDRRVKKLAPGTTTPTTVPLPKLIEAERLAVDDTGDVFVTDSDRKLLYEMPAGDTKALKLAIGNRASAVAVDAAGNVYFATSATTDDSGNVTQPGTVFKLAPNG